MVPLVRKEHFLIPQGEKRFVNDDKFREYVLDSGDSYGGSPERKYKFRSLTLSNLAYYSSNEKKVYPNQKCTLMKVEERYYEDGVNDTIITIEAINPKDVNQIHEVSYSIEGQKNVLYSSSSYPSNVLYGELTHGLTTYDQLPERIDTLKTAKAFIKQFKTGMFKKRIFSRPMLVLPK